MSTQDSELVKDINHKIEQAKRNIDQGEIGRTLAMNKINEIKLSLSQIKDNFQKEAELAVSNGKGAEPMQTVQQK